MALPVLIVISGPPGTGKTTLAHALARSVCCPAICRDEIKEGMAHAVPGYTASPGDELTRRASTTFFSVLDVLIDQQVTLVAEAAFQDVVWRPALERFSGRAELRVVRCTVDVAVARERIRQRLGAGADARKAHADVASLLQGEPHAAFAPISLEVPTLDVDTTAEYSPGLAEIAAFARARAD